MLGKISFIALKDCKNQKIPLKKDRYVKYHKKIGLLAKNSIPSLPEATASAPWISVNIINAKK